MWRAQLALLALGALLGPLPVAQASEDKQPVLPAELEPVRAALEKYRDPIAAVHDGYYSTLGCVHYAEGGMGIHFLNVGLIGPVPDPMVPQLLIYEPDGEGTLHLVAAEWLIPLATGIEGRPELFGQAFNGPMEGHVPLMPKELHHYDLHVWLFKENPDGLFSTTNPNVDCAGKHYALLEEPPPEVPHH